jgi:hypothetical protein
VPHTCDESKAPAFTEIPRSEEVGWSASVSTGKTTSIDSMLSCTTFVGGRTHVEVEK